MKPEGVNTTNNIAALGEDVYPRPSIAWLTSNCATFEYPMVTDGLIVFLEVRYK